MLAHDTSAQRLLFVRADGRNFTLEEREKLRIRRLPIGALRWTTRALEGFRLDNHGAGQMPG